MSMFRVAATCGQARLGVLATRHGEVATPAFMPVATQGSIKALTPEEVSATGTRLVIMNTYHLWLRPGPELIARHGGLHGFCRWPHAIVTDSGGFQAFSLSKLTRLTPDGFRFSSHLDGTPLFLSPEEAMRIQGLLGSDIAMQLDVCPKADCTETELADAVELTTRWAERSVHAKREGQALFAIVQGGTNVSLRREHAARLARLDVDGLALGGFSVGEPPEQMHRTLVEVAPHLDAARPRYLMGVGTLSDILRAVANGVDLFDCVLPTRNARNGQAFLSNGKLSIRNARYRDDSLPLEPGCRCPTCSAGYTRAFLRHAFIAREIIAFRLITLHNVHVYAELMAEIRRNIGDSSFTSWAKLRLDAFSRDANDDAEGQGGSE